MVTDLSTILHSNVKVTFAQVAEMAVVANVSPSQDLTH